MSLTPNSHKWSKREPSDFLNSSSDFDKAFRDVFRSVFISNCHLDDASITAEELETLEELDQVEILENLKDLVDSLLNFKSNIKAEGSGELAMRCEQLEKMLQKQESDVRAHIRNEHQLKLHIDSIQQKLVETEARHQEALVTIKEMEGKGCESMQSKLQKIETRFHLELSKVAQRYRSEAENNLKENEKVLRLEEMYEKKEKSYMKLQQDFKKIKAMLDETTKECNALRKEIERHGGVGSSEALTKRKEESCERNFNKVQIINKSGTIEKTKKTHVRKRSGDIPSQFSKHFLEPSPPAESRPRSVIKATMHSSRKHMRSHSEYTRPQSSKKFYCKY